MYSPYKVSHEMQYGRMFDNQATKLIDAKLAQEATIGLTAFIQQLLELRNLLSRVPECKTNQTPFLIVVPRTLVPVSRQMELLSNDDQRGSSLLDDGGLVNQDEETKVRGLYLAAVVEDGPLSSAFAPHDFSEVVRMQGRHNLTVEEGVAKVRSAWNVLNNGSLNLLGTRYMRRGQVPFLTQGMQGPMLDALDEKSMGVTASFVPICAFRLYNTPK